MLFFRLLRVRVEPLSARENEVPALGPLALNFSRMIRAPSASAADLATFQENNMSGLHCRPWRLCWAVRNRCTNSYDEALVANGGSRENSPAHTANCRLRNRRLRIRSIRSRDVLYRISYQSNRRRGSDLFDKIEALGGMLKAIERGYVSRKFRALRTNIRRPSITGMQWS